MNTGKNKTTGRVHAIVRHLTSVDEGVNIKRLLIANRGEVAMRICRTAVEFGIETVVVYSVDDSSSLHTKAANISVQISGHGASAYLDAEQIVSVAKENRCDAIHPGYGFLSENADFAALCQANGIIFVGPSPETLKLFGDKVSAKNFAQSCNVNCVPGIQIESVNGETSNPARLEAISKFFKNEANGCIMIKAAAGGGGRGMRIVKDLNDVENALIRCQSEALKAFGNDSVFIESYIAKGKHIEVQIIGDGTRFRTFGERECTVQRQNQKLIEIAPSPSLDPEDRKVILAAALSIAKESKYVGIGTVEFLYDIVSKKSYFIEVNPRLQVEHTVTEEIFNIDLVAAQLRIAQGHKLEELFPSPDMISNGMAMQLRINLESMRKDGTAVPSFGRIEALEMPRGSVRVESAGYSGYEQSPNFDSLLAKIIVSGDSFEMITAKGIRALEELYIEGVQTNDSFLLAILKSTIFQDQVQLTTSFIAENAESLLELSQNLNVQRHFDTKRAQQGKAVLDTPLEVVDGAVQAPMQGVVVSVEVKAGDEVFVGKRLLVLSAMKMEHEILSESSGVVESVICSPNDIVQENSTLIVINVNSGDKVNSSEGIASKGNIDLDTYRRDDLDNLHRRRDITKDKFRPKKVAKRKKRTPNLRTARENINDLVDDGTFVEYGKFAIAKQRHRREIDDLIENTVADGLVGGLGCVNSALYEDAELSLHDVRKRTSCIVMSYDYMVLAGTQGHLNHIKKDRLFTLAEQWKLPVVFFTEGGGGRPGDDSDLGLNCMAFHLWGKLSGKVPLVGVASGRCFAGNAAILGCSDVIIATKGSNIGMGGPAMIEGGGLGIYSPDEIGPVQEQYAAGVVDILVEDESQAVKAVKQYLSYFQGPVLKWTCEDQRILRTLIPENRLRSYEVRKVIEKISDHESVLELRKGWGKAFVTSLIRIEGHPIGVVANNPLHLGGAIDAEGSDKAARFMTLCDNFGIPLLFLCDTPGFMVGPDSEREGMVRRCSNMFIVGSQLKVPTMTIILRKSYGLGAQAMAGGSHRVPIFTVAWPTGEIGPMGLEGAIKLGFKKELESIEDPKLRQETFDKLVKHAYDRGSALNAASEYELDDVIDPLDSRFLISRALQSARRHHDL